MALSWTDNAVNPAATGFVIQRATNPGMTANLVTFPQVAVLPTTFTDTTVGQHATYYYQVQAVATGNPVGPSAWSNVAGPATTPGQLPAAPTGLGATISGPPLTVNLSWTPGLPPGGPVTSYRVQRALGAGTFANLGAPTTATTFADTTASSGTAYRYQVLAVNADGNSAPSNILSLTTPTLPGAPTSVAATAGNASATVTFAAPTSDGGSPILGYTVTSVPAGGVDSNAGTTALSHLVTGLTNGTPYRFTVRATNAVGTGPASAQSNSVTPATVPGAPTGVSAVAGNTTATVTFTAPASNGGSAINLYTVIANPGPNTASATTAGPITVTGLINGTAYSFTVTARNAVGTGPASAPSNSVIPTAPSGLPAAPSNLRSSSITTSSVILNWNNNATNQQGFYVQRSADGGATWSRVAQTAANTTTFRNTGLTTKTAYQYRVQAFNATGVSGFSNTLTVTTN